jgi:hypothetical protein
MASLLKLAVGKRGPLGDRRLGTACAIALAVVGIAGEAHAQQLAGAWEGELVKPDAWPTFIHLDVERGTGKSTLSVLGQKIDLGRARDDRLNAKIGDPPEQQSFNAHVESGELKGTLVGAGTNVRFSLARVADVAPPAGRIAGWNSDLDAVRDRMLRYDRSFSAAERAVAKTNIARLRKAIPTLSDDAMRVRIAKLLALAHNAHTRLYLLRNRTELGRLPIRVWWFGNQLRIVRSTPEFSRLIGCRITSLNGATTAQAFEKVQGMYAGSPTWKRYMSQYTLTSPSVLRGAGVGQDVKQARVSVGSCAAAGSYVLSELPFERSEKAVESWWDLAPRSPSALQGWKHVLDGKPLPAYLNDHGQAYRFDQSRPDKIAYVKLSRAANSGSESVKDFAARVAAAIRSRNPPAIVIDLRFNTGGDSTITKALVDDVVGAAGGRPIYLIVGRSTFSAGIIAAAQFRQATKIKIVGEPIGDDLEFWSEGGNIILPYSGLAAHFANGAHSLSPRACPTAQFCNDLSVQTLAPDIAVAPRWSDYVAGIDAPMKAIAVDLGSGNRRP